MWYVALFIYTHHMLIFFLFYWEEHATYYLHEYIYEYWIDFLKKKKIRVKIHKIIIFLEILKDINM